jgi:hypothetical protein
MDSISNNFLQLSVGDSHVSSEPTTTQALQPISLDGNVFADHNHKPLDAKILNRFCLYWEQKKEPDLPILLSNITLDDKRLVTLTTDDAEALLMRYPSITKLLRNTWQTGSFKELRQLGASMLLI